MQLPRPHNSQGTSLAEHQTGNCTLSPYKHSNTRLLLKLKHQTDNCTLSPYKHSNTRLLLMHNSPYFTACLLRCFVVFHIKCTLQMKLLSYSVKIYQYDKVSSHRTACRTSYTANFCNPIFPSTDPDKS